MDYYSNATDQKSDSLTKPLDRAKFYDFLIQIGFKSKN